MATVTKRHLVTRISNDTGLTQYEVAEVLQQALDQITESLASGDKVALRRFGTFDIVETKSKLGRNPRKPTDEVMIPARAVVKFKPGNELREKVAATLPVIREQKK